MAGSLSDYAENKILAHSVGKAAWPAIPKVYIALYNTAPNENTTGTEVNNANTGYQRFEATAEKWESPENGEIKNLVEFTFGPASASWNSVEGVAVIDQSTTPESIIWYGTFTSPRMVVAGEKLIFDPKSFVLSLT